MDNLLVLILRTFFGDNFTGFDIYEFTPTFYCTVFFDKSKMFGNGPGILTGQKVDLPK